MLRFFIDWNLFEHAYYAKDIRLHCIFDNFKMMMLSVYLDLPPYVIGVLYHLFHPFRASPIGQEYPFLSRIYVGLRPRQGNRLVFRLFKSYARLASIRLKQSENEREISCRGLNPIIDYFSHPLY